jgi:LacI family transcriptional regulator
MTESESTRAARLSDVARLAGVSTATASRALNGSDRGVREANRLKVVEAARVLGYTANVAAQAVARGRNRGVTLVVKGIPDDYANPIISGVVGAAQRRGLPVTIATAGMDPADLVDAVHSARSHRPEIDRQLQEMKVAEASGQRRSDEGGEWLSIGHQPTGS